jgi:hypothetical protein
MEEVKKWLRVQHSTFYKKGTEALVSRWFKAVEVEEICRKIRCVIYPFGILSACP